MIMSERKKRSFLKGIPAWGLSLMTAFLSLFLVFLFAGLFYVLGLSEDIGDFLAYLCYGVVVALASFLICKRFPRSFWYVPIVCNAVGIIAAIVEPNFWITPMWIPYSTGWILSLAGTIAGVILGKRNLAQT